MELHTMITPPNVIAALLTPLIAAFFARNIADWAHRLPV
jgi:hypothetical protein